MAITVEDGSGVAGANSYATVAQLMTYAASRGVELEIKDHAAEVLLLKGMDYIRRNFSNRLQGTRVDVEQALDFPRYNVMLYGEEQDYDAIPQQLIDGQLAAAIAVYQDDTERAGVIKREKLGDIEVEYDTQGSAAFKVAPFEDADYYLNLLSTPPILRAVRS